MNIQTKIQFKPKYIGILAVVFAGLLTSFCPKEFSSLMVVRDCTGTYLRKDSTDFPVCNAQLLEGIAEGTIVRVSYKSHAKGTRCEGQEGVRCMMVHPFPTGDWVEIKALRKSN